MSDTALIALPSDPAFIQNAFSDFTLRTGIEPTEEIAVAFILSVLGMLNQMRGNTDAQQVMAGSSHVH